MRWFRRFRAWHKRRSDAAFARAFPIAGWVVSFESAEELADALLRGEQPPGSSL